jgi:hypothetical protein
MTPRPPLTPAEEAAFADLQTHLLGQWRAIATHSHDEQSVVVVPSMSLDLDYIPSAMLQAYEERFLFLMLLLRQPRLRVIYVTSQPVQDEVVDYYLGLLQGVIVTHARARLHRVAVRDGTSRPLSLKLLERPRLIQSLRALIPDPTTCHLIPFNTTDLEKELALRLGIPMYAADPRFAPLGTKNGGRRLFAEEGVPHPAGRLGIRSPQDLVRALAELRAERPGLRQALVKLDEGVSGMGNALVDLADLPAPGDPAEPAALAERVGRLMLESDSQTVAAYLAALAAQGGVVEERLQGEAFRSPSVQMRVSPLGEVEVLSTHDQLLGGPSGMSFLGSVFPADPAYARTITEEALKIGRRLAADGVIGRFAIDFVAVRDAGGRWEVYGIELNLRKGGTTAPYLTLEFLTQGHYHAQEGVFRTRLGQPRYYVSSDHVESEAYRVLSAMDLFDVAMREELHFSSATETGIVYHMMAAVTEFGRFGLTAVADSPASARALYDRAIAAVDREAEAAARG